MQEIVDSLVTNAQAITKTELVNHVIDGLGYEFDLTIIHITSTIDFTTESITLANAKFVLQNMSRGFKSSLTIIMIFTGSYMNLVNRTIGVGVDLTRNYLLFL